MESIYNGPSWKICCAIQINNLPVPSEALLAPSEALTYLSKFFSGPLEAHPADSLRRELTTRHFQMRLVQMWSWAVLLLLSHFYINETLMKH